MREIKRLETDYGPPAVQVLCEFGARITNLLFCTLTADDAAPIGVYVKASHRGKGIGQALVAALLKRAKTDPSLEQISLAVATCQQAASHLYRKLGFEIYGIEPRALKVGSEYVDQAYMVFKTDNPAHMRDHLSSSLVKCILG